MVCQLRPLVYSLGLNNPPHICLAPRKSRIKNLWRNKQGNCRCKMAGAGIQSLAKFCGQMPRIATTGIASWQTTLKWTADCHVPRSGCRGQVKPVAIRSQIHTSVYSDPWSKCSELPQSAAHIWARNLARGRVADEIFLSQNFTKYLFRISQNNFFICDEINFLAFQYHQKDKFYVKSP
jgi:hypothetical protein